MPYSQVPAFVATLSDGTEDRAGKFVILTGVRRKEGLAWISTARNSANIALKSLWAKGFI